MFDRSSKKTFLCDPQKITEILSPLSLSLSLPVRSALLYFFVRLSFVPWPKRGNKRLEMQPPFQESFVYPWQSFLEIPINGRSAGRWWSERRACVSGAGPVRVTPRARAPTGSVCGWVPPNSCVFVRWPSRRCWPASFDSRYNKRGYVYASSDKRPRT